MVFLLRVNRDDQLEGWAIVTGICICYFEGLGPSFYFSTVRAAFARGRSVCGFDQSNRSGEQRTRQACRTES